MKQLADVLAEVTMILEMLRQCDERAAPGAVSRKDFRRSSTPTVSGLSPVKKEDRDGLQTAC